jgi:hypothetical protein
MSGFMFRLLLSVVLVPAAIAYAMDDPLPV